MTLFWLVFGLVVLTIGAEFLVRGASKLAVGVGISPLVVGLTVVAFGTSAPELVVSFPSADSGNQDIAVGNVVGSNLFNMMAGLGISSLIAPAGIAVTAHAFRANIPVMIAVAVVCLPIFFTGSVIARG